MLYNYEKATNTLFNSNKKEKQGKHYPPPQTNQNPQTTKSYHYHQTEIWTEQLRNTYSNLCNSLATSYLKSLENFRHCLIWTDSAYIQDACEVFLAAGLMTTVLIFRTRGKPQKKPSHLGWTANSSFHRPKWSEMSVPSQFELFASFDHLTVENMGKMKKMY